MTLLRKVRTAISSEKRKLIRKAKKSGLYENFGDNEIRNLRDRFVNSSSYTDEMNAVRNAISEFSKWCGWFDDTQLEQS